MARYVFITGGVVSSLGKGLASAALGALLQARGHKVRLRKLDPYLNVDPEGLVFVPNATSGLNIVARSFPLQPCDEVVFNTHEYGALDLTWEPAPSVTLTGVIATAMLVAAIGVLASLDVLRHKPLATLRAE